MYCIKLKIKTSISYIGRVFQPSVYLQQPNRFLHQESTLSIIIVFQNTIVEQYHVILVGLLDKLGSILIALPLLGYITKVQGKQRHKYLKWTVLQYRRIQVPQQ